MEEWTDSALWDSKRTSPNCCPLEGRSSCSDTIWGLRAGEQPCVKKLWGSSGQWDECRPAMPWQQTRPAAFWDALEGAEPQDQGFTAGHGKRVRHSRCKLEHTGSTWTQINILPVRAAAKRGRAFSILMGFQEWVRQLLSSHSNPASPLVWMKNNLE